MKEVGRRQTAYAESEEFRRKHGDHEASEQPDLAKTLRDEIAGVRPRIRLLQGLSNLLPHLCFGRLRTALWRTAQLPIGRGSLVMGDLLLSGTGEWPTLLSVGEDTFITGPLRVNLGGAVRIGNRVNIGHDCLLLTVDHEIGTATRRAGWSTHGDIVIEDGVWLASRVTVLPGVTIGEGAVVAAGSVVASSVAPHTLVGGIPAKLLRKLDVASEPTANGPD